VSRTPVSAVLSDELAAAIAKRRVKAAVFLTFQFDPAFFEEEILPLLFEQSFSHIPQIRLVQLEERLRNVEHVAVYYDRRGLTPEAGPARLDYRRFGLLCRKGFFHPKNIFLLIENQDGDRRWESLLLATLSANLTRAGWWENVEVAYITEIASGEKCTYRQELLSLISRLKQEDTIPEEHAALETIRSFLLKNVEEAIWFRKQGRLLPRLYLGQTPLPEFLAHFVEPNTYNLEIISPYFDQVANSKTLSQLIERLRPKATRVFLPRANDGSAECLEHFFSQVQQLPQVFWGLLPNSVIGTSSVTRANTVQRHVHAKVYRFWNQVDEFLFIGSVNLTAPAHSVVNAGNFETGVLIEIKVTGQQGWWLQALGNNIPTEFHKVSFEETDISEPPCEVTFSFDWDSNTLTYYWEASSFSTHQRADIFAQNISQFMISPIEFNKWISLPTNAAEHIKELLSSTSLVEVSVDGGNHFRALIREEGMARKPTLFLSLTPEEILHYWSLLSPEQRELFILQKSLIDIDGYVRKSTQPQSTEDSMFDRFAGIVHAFGRLEEHVRDSLEAGNETEVVYRLLGEKYDSLPSLIEKIIKDEESDRVRRYVTILCARQVLDRIEKDFPDFRAQHRPSFNFLRNELREVDKIEAGFTFETPEIRAEFFAWFREMFLRPSRLPKGELHDPAY
jgi:hypothetical protein